MKAKFTVPYMVGGMVALLGAGQILNSQASYIQNIPTGVQKLYTGDTVFNVVDSIQMDTTVQMFDPRPVKVIDKKHKLLYICENGDTICRMNGSRAWRNNNPGNLVYGEFARDNGAIGKGGKFAVFPNEETGRAALTELLKGDKYNNLTIARAIIKYAPPHENNVGLYKKKMRKLTGLSLDMRLSQLTPEQLAKVVDAICIIEGWTPGKETLLAANNMPAPKNLAMIKMMRDSAMQKTL